MTVHGRVTNRYRHVHKGPPVDWDRLWHKLLLATAKPLSDHEDLLRIKFQRAKGNPAGIRLGFTRIASRRPALACKFAFSVLNI